ncbi:MAG: hypothetical protein HYW78_00040 [Parcubacteria group bacterium]|nr:hypothetical protein [Parcubacteria group bacterium]
MKKGFITAVLILLTKFTKLAKLFKVLKLLKFTKPIITFFSMAFSALVYSFFLTPWFAVGFTIMLFVHEMGHIVAMRIKGMPTPGPVFIPMLGAVIFAPEFKSKKDEAFVGFAGPLVGGLAAVALFGLWAILPQKSELLLLISYTAVFINLFNLLPIRPLDGGRTTQIIGEWFKYIGLAVLLLFSLYIRQPMVLLIWILVIVDIPMNAWLKCWIGIICQIAMMILMFSGFSDQHQLIDLMDMIIATMFNVSMYGAARKFDIINEIEENRLVSQPEEKIETSIKIVWFARYIALVILFIVVMTLQAHYLPHAAK